MADTHARTPASAGVSKLILASAAIELVTGIVLIFIPSILGTLILGVEFPDIARGVARLAGVALVAFAIACWPQQRSLVPNAGAAIRGLLAYNFLAAVYFCYWWVAYHSEGPLLWWAAALHAVFAALFLHAALRYNATNVKVG